MWDLSCPDWEQRLRDGRPLVPDLPFLDKVAAKRAVDTFNLLRVPDVEGTPTFADAAGDWFRAIVAAMFGSYDPVAAIRYITELLLLVPKKNTKTTSSSGVMLTALLLNKRPLGELQLIAPTQEIADGAFSKAVGMIEADDRAQREINGTEGFLKRRLRTRDHIKTIVDLRTKALLKIKTFDADVVTGGNTIGSLIDELHLLGKHADAARIILQIRGGMLAKPESFLIFITTQSDEPPEGVFKAELQQARAIRDGRLKGLTKLPVLYEFPEAITAPVRQGARPAWLDPALWPQVNPNCGRSITVSRLQALYADAESKGEDEVRLWASQYLNIEIGLALRSDAWAGTKYWERQVDETIATLDALLARCEVVVVGIDGGGLDDLLGLCVLGRDRETRDWLAWHHTWAHEGVLEIRKSEAPKLRDFEKAGHLTIVARAGDHFVEAADIVERVDASGKLPDRNAIGMDSVGTGLIVDALDEKQLGNQPDKPPRVIAVSQGWKLNGAIKTTEVMLARGTLWHGGQPILAWAVGNAKVEPRGNAISITKQAAGTAKIDPLMALFNAAALMAMNPEAAGSFPSDYELPVIG